MASAAEVIERQQDGSTEWGGGKSPLRVSEGKMGMWLFLMSDALTFAALLLGYLMIRFSSPSWPVPSEVFGIGLVTIMTTILMMSSATLALAVGSAHKGDRAATLRFLLITIIGGAIFLGLQAYEWTHFIQAGARPFSNPFGPPMFSGSFFIITGVHGLHVLSGVIYLIVVAYRVYQNTFSGDFVERAGLYWHFVDIVWVLVFTLFYLI
ncbi:MAG TPA: cytochrome c oxidase subunit 3 [Sphingobacteriaceae bacterium]|nr:cytochrome c oxidase subunit 3 [Sphingobacteriaceae bacterium]